MPAAAFVLAVTVALLTARAVVPAPAPAVDLFPIDDLRREGKMVLYGLTDRGRTLLEAVFDAAQRHPRQNQRTD